jgi:tRNA-binding protein
MPAAMKHLPVKPLVTFDELAKIDIRVGTIHVVEDVAGSDKLVRLTVDFGEFQRNVIVGMKKERANPGEITGSQALFVVNLEPRRIMGEMSHGMLFDIGYANGVTPVLAMPEKPVPNGACAG